VAAVVLAVRTAAHRVPGDVRMRRADAVPVGPERKPRRPARFLCETVYHLAHGWSDRAMTDPTTLVRALDAAGYRQTGPRRALATLVAALDGPFTSARVVEEARAQGLRVGRATVFRTLEALENAGAIERIDLPSGEHAYVGCAPAHHHHVVCSTCGRTAEVADGDLAALVERIGRRTGYLIEAHRLEMYGLCPGCRVSS
jgi:Fur family ferric uptake transcriptional regulator